MKKLLSLLLVVLLLGSVTAFAENTTYYAFSDPVVDLQGGEEPVHVDLTGMSLAVAPVEVDGQEIVAFNILGNGTPLFAAAFHVAEDKLLVDVDGWSHTYCAAIPALQEEAEAEVEADPFAGLDIDALTAALMNELELTMKGDTVNFVLPYTAVNSLMQQLLPMLAESVSLPEGLEDIDLNEIAELFAEMEKEDSGVTLSGSFTQNESISAALDCYLVENGEASSEPLFSAVMRETEEDFSLDILLVGEISVHVGLNAESGKLDFQYQAEEQSFGLTGFFGSEEGEIKVAQLGEAAGAIDVQQLTEEQTEELGNETLLALNDLLEYLTPVLNEIM